MTDVRTRIVMATQRFGKLRNIWRDDNLHLNLRMRLYKSLMHMQRPHIWVRSMEADEKGEGGTEWRQLEDVECDHGEHDT